MMINAKLYVSKAFGPVDDAPVRCLNQEPQTKEPQAETAPAPAVKADAVSAAGYSRATVQLARDMADRHDLLKGLLKSIRTAISSNKATLFYDMSNKTAEEREGILSIAFRMRALIADICYNKENYLLQGRIADVPAVISFLGGRYMEVAVAEKVREIVAKYAAQHGFRHAVSQNVIITTGAACNELDLLVEVNNVRFAIEVKSGDCRDYEKYYHLSYNHGLLPDHFMVVSSNVDSETAEMVHDFYQYYVSDLNFEDTLLHMLRRGCEQEANHEN